MSTKTKVLGVTLAAMMLLAGQPTKSQPQCDPIRLAEEAIPRLYIGGIPEGRAAAAKDLGDVWEVTYPLPEYALGRTPVVHVDKKACRIVRYWQWQ